MRAGCIARSVPAMEWIDACVPRREGILGDLDDARRHVADAALALRRAHGAEWVSVAADGYRAEVARQLGVLRLRAATIDALETSLRSAEVARAAVTEERAW